MKIKIPNTTPPSSRGLGVNPSPKRRLTPQEEMERKEAGQERKKPFRGDLSGKKFGRLLVIKKATGNGPSKWLCLCDCGEKRTVYQGNLLSRGSGSCGCLQREVAKASHLKHGKSISPEYESWSAMRNRCLNKNADNYSRYGGRGILVCDRWLESFSNFYSDMGPRPSGTSLGRIDNDGNYCPENCKWESCFHQSRNKSNNVKITLNGMTKCMSDWDRFLGFRVGTILDRTRRGWDLMKALSTPKLRRL